LLCYWEIQRADDLEVLTVLKRHSRVACANTWVEYAPTTVLPKRWRVSAI
jgi:hypothetical protein